MSDLYAILNKLAYEELEKLGIPKEVLDGVYGMFYRDFTAGKLDYYSFDEEKSGDKTIYRIKKFRIKIADLFENNLFEALAIMYHEIYHLKTIWENGMVVEKKERECLVDKIKSQIEELKCDLYGYTRALEMYPIALSLVEK